uniref:Uncharacterized protein n=1 Tax=Fagus sylvatica TaxID=28930 RepID=A0A2N9FBH0_FAGSY
MIEARLKKLNSRNEDGVVALPLVLEAVEGRLLFHPSSEFFRFGFGLDVPAWWLIGLRSQHETGLGLGLGFGLRFLNAGVVVVSWGCDLGVVVAWGCDLGVVGAWACRSRRGGASDLADLADLGLGLPISASACLLSSSSFPA